MSEEDHVQQDVERIGQRHQDREWGCPREEHQSASDRLEKANPKNQVASFLKREHELIEFSWRIANRIPVHAETHRHDPGSDKEQREEYPHDEGEKRKSNAAFF